MQMDFDYSSLLYLVHPSTILVAGPTGSGKTVFVSKLIKERKLHPMANLVTWVYSKWQVAYEQFPQVEFVHDFNWQIISDWEQDRDKPARILVLDDQMTRMGDDKQHLTKLFTEDSHHLNMTVVYLVQNVFDQGKAMRGVSLNSHYEVLFKNPRDKSQIRWLAHQMYPEDPQILTEAYQDATSKPFSYLIADHRPETPEDYRLRTGIFEGEELILYVPTRNKRRV